MSLRDNIRSEIENGNLPEIFETRQVYELRRSGRDHCYVNNVRYTIVAIRTDLPNHSVGPEDRIGEAVRRGGEAHYLKLPGRSTYSMLDGAAQGGEDLAVPEDPPNTGPNGIEPSGKDKIAAAFVEYLRNKPFRIKLNKGNAWYPKKGPVTGWKDRLDKYEWDKNNWKETSKILDVFIKDLAALQKELKTARNTQIEDEAAAIYERIRTWGNRRGTERNGKFVLERLNELWNGDITAVDSTLTKLYAFAKPEDYIIFDSRVATAIITAAEDIYRFRSIKNKPRQETVNTSFHNSYPNLGTYSTGAGGTRPRGFRWKHWPKAEGSVKAQLDANDLCKRIVTILNSDKENERTNWTMREIEAVLFMEGY